MTAVGAGGVRREYAHARTGEEVRSIAGAYVIEEERRMNVGGREVLVVLGHATFDTSCCGAGGCRYALVPGYVLSWNARPGDAGETRSIVEPVRGEEVRREIRERIRATEVVQQVDFW